MKRACLLLILLLAAALSFAVDAHGRGGGGGGGGGGGAGGGRGGGGQAGPGPSAGGKSGAGSGQQGLAPVRNICQGSPFTCQGLVVHEIGPLEGQGLVVLADGRTMTIYGIGPRRFWEGMGLERPGLGQRLTVRGYTVDYNGVLRHMATHLEVEGREIRLRRGDDCRPAWEPSAP